VSWLKISQVFNNDLLLGCVYIPPENSLYSSIDAFLDIENELVSYIEKDMKCALAGDFNAKTAVLEDFSEPGETFLNVMDVNVEDDLFRYYCDYQVLLDNNISLKRYTQCECRPNNFGRKLLEMCKSNNLCIANSRIDKDKNISKKTCNDLSVVDYLILSSNLFSVIKKFDVLDYDPLFSDVHCALYSSVFQ
jgi:hypothetical protein